jgi:hypothetical protein
MVSGISDSEILETWDEADGADCDLMIINFARLIAAKQREIDAKLCDKYDDNRGANMADLCAEAIRNQP